jgi:MerR family transcriptional regulator, thiopeptide resistance regulator
VTIQEFAEQAGVTVRTLHHYDRLGLLSPRRNGSGYRIYRDRDLERLEQIVALKFLGLPLKQIRRLLVRETGDLPRALRMQRLVLEQKRRLLDRAIRALRDAERQPEPAQLKKIIEVIGMQDNTDWKEKYYGPEARAKIEARRHEWNPEMQARVSKEWADLMADVEAALGEDPAGERAQALAARWKKLVEGFTGGDPEIASGLRKLYADQANWPGEFKQQMGPFLKKEVWEFMAKAMSCAAGLPPAE